MKVLAFDLGKVIFDFDYSSALERIKNKGASVEEILRELYENDFGLDFEKGLVSPEEFYLDFKSKFNAVLDYAEFKDIWSDIFIPNHDVINLVKELRKIHPTYLISNINALHFEFLNARYPEVFALFTRLILSYKVKSVKPEKQIYEELRKTAGTDYQNIIYIDDRDDLITKAKLLDLQCIRFENIKQLIEELSYLGVHKSS